MQSSISRADALALLRTYNREPFHIQHALTVEGVMRWYAKELGYGGEVEYWGIVGLLHDIDFEQYPQEHCLRAPQLLRDGGVSEEMIHSVCSHGYGICCDVEPTHEMEKVLFAADELTGLIGAAARMRPSGSVADMEVSSLKKKFKDKRFAAGCSRDVIRTGAERLGWTLDDLMEKTILAMRSCEAQIARECEKLQETRPFVGWKLMGDFMTAVFEKCGVPSEDARVCTDVLLESDRRGIESHGCNRFKPIYIDRIKDGILNPVTEFEVVKETPTTAVIDGHNGMGMVIGTKAMQMAIDKAKAYGMGMTAVRNSTHYGIAGYYATMCTKNNMIGITGTNARPSIAPTFGVENMLGTNPITFGIPTDEPFPFVLDCATSISQRGKIEYYARMGQPTPAGMVIGRDGSALTDSKQILEDLNCARAALAPLGGIGETLAGYKGYGYATVVEILSAALQAGSFLKMLSGKDADGNKIPYPLGHFFIAIDTEAFMGAESFKKTAGEILRQLRASEKAPGQKRIFTAGEKEYEIWQFRKDKGVPVGEAVQKELISLRDEFGLTQFRFPFES